MTCVLIGQTLGQYKLAKELGKGGFATVYRAVQPTLKRNVAIKVLHPEFIRDERTLRRFKREALAIARLSHPNIVAVYDYGEHDGRAYLVMEYVAGDTLKGRLGKPVASGLALDVVTAVGAALDYAHSKGLVHRDIKPANILFTEDSRIVLSDFGIVRLADDDSSLTRGIVGTPQYMSPEQTTGGEVDGRCDLYSLGVVLFEMLTGRVPFKGESAIATLSMHASMPVPSARERNPDLTEGIDRVVRRSLAKAPDDRYQTGRDLQQALAAAIAEAERPPEPTMMITSPTTDPGSAPSVATPPQDLESMYRQLLELTRSEDWRGAVNIAAQILARDSNYRDVSAILASASNELRFGRSTTSVEIQMRDLISRAEGLISSGRLMEAAASLQQVLRADPNDTTARARLDEVNKRMAEQETQRRRHSRLEQLYSLAQSKVRASDWRWAHHILEEISAIDPTYRDVPALFAQAQENLKMHEVDVTPTGVANLRDQAEAAMANLQWDQAVRFWEEVLRSEPSLAGVAERLETARQQAALTNLNAEAAQLAADGRWEEAIQKLEQIKQIGGR